MALALQIGKCTLLGNYRENNEDAIDVKQSPDLTICIVADGMGGQQAGEIASKQAIEVMPAEMKKNVAATTDADETKQLIRRAIVQTNSVIMDMAALDRDLTNMGTTIVAAAWRKASNLMYIATAGDSRAYLIRGNKIAELTIAHSIAQALGEAQTISSAAPTGPRPRTVL